MNGGLSAYHIFKDALKNPESHYQFDKNAQLIAQYYIDAIDYFVKPDIILRAKTQKIPRPKLLRELKRIIAQNMRRIAIKRIGKMIRPFTQQ